VEYRPLEARGPLAAHLCAFARVADAEVSLTVVPIHLAGRRIDDPPLGPDYWGDTWLAIPDGLGARFRNVLAGESIEVGLPVEGCGLELGRALAGFPVALLVRTAENQDRERRQVHRDRGCPCVGPRAPRRFRGCRRRIRPRRS